ncbi:enterochelin ABC transporter CeuBCDE, permease protein [Campylobacter novaezeelandiae]|uniref:enterochelin ABC transporter permease CeuB n=1 Tax=Campylobacter novaezeelandiae TaxID=2267891 RepID=UPI001C73FD71|nr:iron chelate uptake ABC transporter family permease subunit [Campylobacter novaezeelandiae]QWU80036.1 enterochelin ABC transporter CeuBCDE, permease protein [Campylobacter novaezeelandiae]
MFSCFIKLKVLLSLLFIFSIVSVFIGVKDISLFSLNNEDLELLFITRIPRIIAIIITGMSLGICGLIMQQITQNKFVSPTTAGTMDCARFGILISLVFFNTYSFLFQTLIACIFTMLGSIVFIQILRKIKFKDSIFIPLVGLMFGGIINSLTTFFAYSLNYIQNIQGWLQGSFANVMQGNYELIYISLPMLVVAYIFANKITIVGMGKEVCINLGISYNFVLGLGLFIVSIITSVIVLTVGVIPFLGLIIPNIISIYKGDNLKRNLSYIALSGALFLLICDIFARIIIFPFEMPISIVAGVFGSLIFIWILLKRKNG